MVRSECARELLEATSYSDVDKVMKKLDRLKEFRGLFESLRIDQLNKYHKYNIRDHIIYTVLGVESDVELRWAALFHDIGKRDAMTIDHFGHGHFIGHPKISASMTRDILKVLRKELKLSDKTCIEIIKLVELHDSLNYTQAKSIKYNRLRQFISENGANRVYKILKLRNADINAQSELSIALKNRLGNLLLDRVIEIERDGTAFREQDLRVNREDLIKIGFKPSELDNAIHVLLKNTWGEPKNNTYDILMNIAKHYKKFVKIAQMG